MKYEPKFAPVDIELLQIRSKLTPGQRLQAMLDARELAVGFIRGRLIRQFDTLSMREINLKVLEEIELVKNIRPRFKPFTPVSNSCYAPPRRQIAGLLNSTP